MRRHGGARSLAGSLPSRALPAAPCRCSSRPVCSPVPARRSWRRPCSPSRPALPPSRRACGGGIGAAPPGAPRRPGPVAAAAAADAADRHHDAPPTRPEPDRLQRRPSTSSGREYACGASQPQTSARAALTIVRRSTAWLLSRRISMLAVISEKDSVDRPVWLSGRGSPPPSTCVGDTPPAKQRVAASQRLVRRWVIKAAHGRKNNCRGDGAPGTLLTVCSSEAETRIRSSENPQGPRWEGSSGEGSSGEGSSGEGSSGEGGGGRVGRVAQVFPASEPGGRATTQPARVTAAPPPFSSMSSVVGNCARNEKTARPGVGEGGGGHRDGVSRFANPLPGDIH
jgi:hypothetical protein